MLPVKDFFKQIIYSFVTTVSGGNNSQMNSIFMNTSVTNETEVDCNVSRDKKIIGKSKRKIERRIRERE